MQHFGTQFGSFCFAALLPPSDHNEISFYKVLGVETNATDDEIRKAYKKASLHLHPDKVAQRGEDLDKKEEAANDYEKVQEAYEVLINEKKRLTFDSVGSPTRYRFIEQRAFANPQALYSNLAQASCIEKSRLVGILSLVIFLLLSQPILIAAKVNQNLNNQGVLQATSWFVIFVPYWIIIGLLIILNLLVAFFVSKGDRLSACFTGLEQISWYISLIFLCLSWDGTWFFVPYRQIFIPAYIIMVLRWSRSIFILRQVRRDIQRMVSVDYLEHDVLKGKSLDELSDEETNELKEAFLVVSVDPDFEPRDADLNEIEIEENKVESSPEFESATDIYNNTFISLACSFVFGGIFLILLTLKLDKELYIEDPFEEYISWWVVFTPIFIERGCRLMYNFYHFCCGAIMGDEIVLFASNIYTEDEDIKDNHSIDDKCEEQEIQNEDCKESVGNENDDMAATMKIKDRYTKVDNNNSDNNGDIRDQDEDSAPADKKSSSKDKTENILSTDAEDDDENTCNDHVDIDEENYYEWQNAYEQAEKNSMKEKSRFFFECCIIIFQIIVLCMIVVKIEKNYNEVNQPDDTGFNIFWILFPFLLFFGLICCCCTLLIYGASQENPEGESDETNYDPAEREENEDISVNSCLVETEETKMEKSKVMNTPPTESNMDDLD